jgi:hypothetical protein
LAADRGCQGIRLARKRAFANYLAYPGALLVVSASANRSKGDQGPAAWVPEAPAAWCLYGVCWAVVTTVMAWHFSPTRTRS